MIFENPKTSGCMGCNHCTCRVNGCHGGSTLHAANILLESIFLLIVKRNISM